MSQVILKLANGDKITSKEQNEKFINWGSRKYKYSDLEEAVMNNSFDEYLSDRGIDGKNAEEIRSYFSNYLNGFKEGKINRNADGTYTVTDLSLSTDMKPIKRGVFGKIRGDKKQIALGYFNTLFDKISPYVEPSKDEKATTSESLIDPNSKAGIVEETPKLEPFKVGYGNFLRRKIFRDENASEEEQKQWFALKDRWTPALEALQDYENSLTGNYDFSKTDFKDINTYKSYIQELRIALENKNPKAVSDALYKMGESDLNSVFQGLPQPKLKDDPRMQEFVARQEELNKLIPKEVKTTDKSIDTNTTTNANPKINAEKEIKEVPEEEKLTWANWSTEDWLRTASIVGDLVGLGLNYSGAGSGASAIAGATSTSLDLIADELDKNVTQVRALLNAATGYGFDLLSIIPGLKSLKTPRTLQTLADLTPKIMKVIGGIDSAANAQSFYDSVTRVSKDPSSASKEDLTNIMNGIHLVLKAGTGIWGNKRYAKKLKSDTKVNVKDNKGNYRTIDKTLAENLKDAKDKKEQTELWKDKDFMLPTKWWSSKWPFIQSRMKVKTKPFYDLEEAERNGATFSNFERWLSREPLKKNYVVLKHGGILKADNGIRFPITNTTQKNSYNRFRDLLNDKSVFDYLDTITPENYMEFNGYEDNYDSNYINTYGKNSLSNWGNTTLNKLNFYKPTKDMQFAWNSRNLNNPIFNGFTPAYGGASGDNTKGFGSDGAFGEMTIERTLGRGIDDATAKVFNNRLKSKGLEYYKDPLHGGYRIRPTGISLQSLNGGTPRLNTKPNWDLSPIGDTSRFIPKSLNSQESSNSENTGEALGKDIGKPKKINPLPFIPGILSGLRFGLNYLHNKNIKYNPKLSFLDAPTLYGKVQYNLPARTLAEKQANQFRRMGTNLASADPNENAARSAEFEFQAHNAEDKGTLADWQTYAKTSENVQNIQNRNILAAIDVSNKNRGKADAVREAKAAFERAKNMKLADNTSKFLYERQANWQNKLNRYNALEDKIKQDELETDFKKSQNDALIAYNKAKSSYKGTSWETSPEYNVAYNAYKQAIESALKNRNNKMWDFQRNRIMFSKKGGSLDRIYLQNVKDYNKQLLENQRELNKLIRLSISENNKTIRGLSNYSARLIEKAIK